ncbi:Negative elongation factor A [Mortierella sp. GBA35]|nr:Negative elongation factor A [Mortierella sp. GBA35]KAG0197420.1 Negative elongation factor A [Mortierella sp. NVP41]
MERLKGEGVQDWLSQHLTSPWHGHQTVASELGNEIIDNIRHRWSDLEGSVQLGVLFSIISLKKAQQLQLKDSCQNLINHACIDPDEWTRLVSKMLVDYPSEGTLRFNLEELVEQSQLKSQLGNLTNHIIKDGIKFHPKEFAYLNESVCREGQGKDPVTKEYPPLTGPSIQQHFNLRDSHVAIHTSRAERLKKIAEQVSPVIGSTASGLSSANTGLSTGGPTGSAAPTPVAAGGASAGAGSSSTAAAAAPGASGIGGPPRPTKASSSGLFVRNKPLPLRSPRVDQPTTPRLIQKASRIQILDIQQGNEIMQSMNDAKAKLEQAEQREKELKREQRAQEIEAKKQQDAEKKAQALKEKEEKKKEREDAKKLKEKQKQERDEQLQRERQEKEQQHNQERETRPLPDDDDEEEDESSSSAVQPARKRTRISSSRRTSLVDDDDYDGAQLGHAPEPRSPVTPSLSSRYSSQTLVDEDGPPPAYTPVTESYRNSDSYFPSHAQQESQVQQLPPQPSGAPVATDHPTLFQDTNLLTADDRAYITAFMEGHPVIRPNGNDTSYQIVMNQEQVVDATGKTMYELILIEMNFETGEWRKIKRKRNRPHVPTPTFPA